MTYDQELERQLAEKTRLLEEVPCGIKVIAFDPVRITYWNRCSEEMYGYTAAEAIGRHPAELLETRFEIPVDRVLAEVFKVGTWRGEVVETRKDGVQIVADLRWILQRDAQGKPAYIISTSTDVTQDKLVLAELARSRDEAEAASQAKSEFLATMSHELRTPLNAIIGYSELLAEDAKEAHVRTDLGRIQSAGRQLLKLIDDILDLAKIEAGHLALSPEPVDLAALVAEVVATSEPMARKGGNDLLVELEPGLGLVQTDAMRLRQVLLNLTSNACKFTHGGTIVLAGRREATGVAFEVRDSGIGIAPEHLERIFRPFQQADASMTRRYGGTGLGLAIARQLCELLGAELTVASTQGEGSTFTVSLKA